MNRRTLLKGSILGTLAAGLRYSPSFADGVSGPGTKSKGFHAFKLGELELNVVSDGSLSLAPVQPFFAPYTDAAPVNTLLKENFRPTDAIALGLNILVIKKGNKNILVDCGIGSGAGDGSGWLAASLSAAGIITTSITDVVLTHGHFDHIGGLLDKNGGLVFPNATYYISKTESDFWLADQQDFSKCPLKDAALLKSTADAAKKIITTIAGKLKFFKSGDHLFDCIRFEAAPGHTPGHTLVIIYSGQEELIHVGDLIHSDVLLFPHPDWGFAGDTDFELAVSTRKKVLGELSQSRKKVMAYHLPWPGLGHVRKDGTGYQWIPEVYVFPG